MKNYLKTLGIILISTFVYADPGFVPEIINYQGRLIENGQLFSGQANIIIRLYDNIAGGNLLLEDTDTVTIVDSLYSTFIGDSITYGSFDIVNSISNVYISVEIDGQLLTPRERMASVITSIKSQLSVYSFSATSASNIVGSSRTGIVFTLRSGPDVIAWGKRK